VSSVRILRERHVSHLLLASVVGRIPATLAVLAISMLPRSDGAVGYGRRDLADVGGHCGSRPAAEEGVAGACRATTR
jgi:hypothetical protein